MPRNQRLAKALERFIRQRVVCFGDVMLDTFVYGDVKRISPESPVPVLHVADERSMLGGAGNVARNIISLGGKVQFITVLGNDGGGHEIERLLARTGHEDSFTPLLVYERGRRSTIKTRFLCDAHHMLRVDEETTQEIEKETADKVLQWARSEIPHGGAVVISDYQKGALPPELLKALIGLTIEHKIPLVVDPKRPEFSLYSRATVLTPNILELERAAHRALYSEAEIATAAWEIMQKHEIQNMVVTRGRRGLSVIEHGGRAEHIDARAIEVSDVSGAGDTVVAMLALGLASGMNVRDAAELANVAAGIVVMRAGTATVTPQDIKLALHTEKQTRGATKIISAGEAMRAAARWRIKRQTVGFTNGCFDLLHNGHVSFLHEARKHCDRLIVGLNSDASVRRLKGAGRPINTEIERALMLAALADVDAVVIFEEDTPITLIEKIKPNVLAKGSDYNIATVCGAALVEANGGNVVIILRDEAYSTTGLLQRARNLELVVKNV